MPAEATETKDSVADPALLQHWLILGIVTLPGRPEYVREARKFVARTLGADHPRADAAILLTSELVTNAVTHSRSRLPAGTVNVLVAANFFGLVISVTDNGSDSTIPVVRSSPGSENGNGLLLVATLADGWGYLRGPGRTMVWFRLCSRERLPSCSDRALLGQGPPAPAVTPAGIRDAA